MVCLLVVLGGSVIVIQGMEVLERNFCFVPEFHDDYVESIVITANRIEMVIQTIDGLSRVQKRDGARLNLYLQG